jgi:VCBS repeat-containing protein
LVLNADGSYTYTLNASNAAVNGLDDGETLTDTFNYTASDGTTTRRRRWRSRFLDERRAGCEP